MTTSDLDALTDKLAKTDSTAFPIAEKLLYYNIADGLLNALILDEQEDTTEAEYTATTVAATQAYTPSTVLHHLNWVKIDYGQGFVPALYRSYQSLISEYGNDLENVLGQWDQSQPIHWYDAGQINIIPVPTSSTAGSGRLKWSGEPAPADIAANGTPALVPAKFHYLHAVYAAFMYHDINGEDGQATKRKAQFDEGARLMIATIFPTDRQAEMQASVPDDDGSDF